MKGGIVERAPTAPKPLGTKPVPQAKAISLPPPAPKKASDVASASQQLKNVPPVVNLMSSQSEYSENDELIKNMSPEEIQEALAEITSLLSKDSINFLMGNSSDRNPGTLLSSDMHNFPDESDDEPPELEPQSSLTSSISYADTTDKISTEITNNKNPDTHNSEFQKIELFDLDGRRVIAKEDAYFVISNAIAKQFHILSLCDPDILLTISRIILSHFAAEHFLWIEEIEEGGAFTLNRALEMSRSQVKMQMISSYKILRGVLMRRDMIVSLPVYASIVTSLDVNTLLQARMLLFRSYSTKYMACIQEITAFTSNDNSLLSEEHKAIFTKSSIEKMVYVALLSLCATDLPPYIPKLLLFGWRAAATYNPTLLTAKLDCLREFVTSMTEHQIATYIDDKYSFGDFDHPRYVTPHVLRPVNSSYEQWHLDRLESLEFIMKDKKDRSHKVPQREEDEEEVLDEEEDDELTGLEALSPGLSEEDKFMLRNRWARVDIVAENEDVSSLLYRMIVQSLDDESFRPVACLCLEVLHVLSIHGSDACREQLCLHVVHPLCSIALSRSGSNPRNGSYSTSTGDAKKILQNPELLCTLLPLTSLSFLQSRFLLLTQALQFQTDISTLTYQYFLHHNAIFKAIRNVLKHSHQESWSIKSSSAPSMHVGRMLSPLLTLLPWNVYFDNLKTLFSGASNMENMEESVAIKHFCELGLHFFFNVLAAAMTTPFNENEESLIKGKDSMGSFQELLKWLHCLHTTTDNVRNHTKFAKQLLHSVIEQYLLPMLAMTNYVEHSVASKLSYNAQYASLLSHILPTGISQSFLASSKCGKLLNQSGISSLLSVVQTFEMSNNSISALSESILKAIEKVFNNEGNILHLLQWANRLHLLVTTLWWKCFSCQETTSEISLKSDALESIFASLLILIVQKCPHLLQQQRVQDGLFRRTISARLQQSLVLSYLTTVTNTIASTDLIASGLNLLEVFQDNTGSSIAFSFLQWWLISNLFVSSTPPAVAITNQSLIVNEIIHAIIEGDVRHKLKLRINKQLQRQWKQGISSATIPANTINMNILSNFITWPLPKNTWMFRGWNVLSLPALTAYLQFIVNLWSMRQLKNQQKVDLTLDEISFCWHQLMRLLRREAASKWYMFFNEEEDNDKQEENNEHAVASINTKKQSVLYEATASFVSMATLLLKAFSASCLSTLPLVEEALSKLFASEYMLTQGQVPLPVQVSQTQVKEEHKRRQEAMLTFQSSILDNMLNYTIGDLDRLAAVSLWLLTVPWQPFSLRRKLWQELCAQHSVSLFILFPASHNNNRDSNEYKENIKIEYKPYQQLLQTLLCVQQIYYLSSVQDNAVFLTSSQFGYHQEIWEVIQTCHLSSFETSSLLASLSRDENEDIHLLIMKYLMRHIVFFIVVGSVVMKDNMDNCILTYKIDNAWSVALLKRVSADLGTLSSTNNDENEWLMKLFFSELRSCWCMKYSCTMVVEDLLDLISCTVSSGSVTLREMLP